MTASRLVSPLASRLLHGTLDAASRVWIRRFEALLPEAPDVNEALLLELVRANADTVYGREHAFAQVRTVADLQRLVPLSDADTYRPYVDRIAAGEAKVLTREPVRFLANTSGTTAHGRLVPITASAQRRVMLHMVLAAQGVVASSRGERPGGPALLLLSSVMPRRSAGGIPIGTATAAGMSRMGAVATHLWAAPAAVAALAHQPSATHLALLYALARGDLSAVQAPFANVVLDLFRVLERDWALLADELERGELLAPLELPGEARAQLVLPRSPERARAVRRACRQGFDGVAARLWPNLRAAVTVTTGSFAVYREQLRRFLGDVPLHSPVYAASEGLVGVGLELEGTRYVVDPLSAGFELIPIERADEAQPPTVLLRHARPGARYEPVLTNRAGFVRYRLGDVVQVVGLRGRAPEIEFLYRRRQLVDLASEKSSEQALQAAVLDAARAWGGALVDFTVRADPLGEPRRYELFVELERPEALGERSEAARDFDRALGLHNPGYANVRAAERLAAPLVHPLRPGAFAAVRELLVSQGASPSQVKIPRVLTRVDLEAVLRARTLAGPELWGDANLWALPAVTLT